MRASTLYTSMVATAIAIAIVLVAGTCLIIMLHCQCCDVGFVVWALWYSNLQGVHSELLLQDRGIHGY